MLKSKFFNSLLISVVLIIGILVRVIQFPENPAGLNIDEASAGYEAYSLSETGKDRWGNEWPAYFPSWGSGQNVLLSYVTIPVVKALGLSIFSIRFPSLLFGLLTLPLFYFCVRPLKYYPAFLGLFLVAVVPWHFMLSHWALESNLVPFFMLAGCAALTRAFITNQRKWIIPSLVPFALALYAYGTTIVVLPLFFGLILILFFKAIRLHLTDWLIATGLFLVISFPFLIFFAESYIVKKNLAWSDSLFFSTPLLPSNRFNPASGPAWSDMVAGNMRFLLSGFNDGTIYNLLPGFQLLLSFIAPLGFIGLIAVCYKLATQKRSITYSSQDAVLFIFFSWAVASLGLVFLFELNVNRFNHFFLPCIVLAVWTIDAIIRNFNDTMPKRTIQVAVVLWFAVESNLAIKSYFKEYPQSNIRAQFHAGLQEAFDATTWLSVKQIKISDKIQLPYVYTLFYTRYSPADFQKQANYSVEDGSYKVNYFGKYVFYDTFLKNDEDYGYLSYRDEFPDNQQRHRKIIFTNELWEVGIMSVNSGK
jgi:hypothetical protein